MPWWSVTLDACLQQVVTYNNENIIKAYLPVLCRIRDKRKRLDDNLLWLIATFLGGDVTASWFAGELNK